VKRPFLIQPGNPIINGSTAHFIEVPTPVYAQPL